MRKIRLTQGKYALVDDEDYEFLNRWKWCVLKRGRNFYAGRNSWKPRHTLILMHRIINKTQKGLYTDHINGNGLDNRKKNLRSCTNAENIQNRTRLALNNTSGTTGVYWDKVKKKWYVKLVRFYKQKFYGYFRNKREAIQKSKLLRKLCI